MRNAAREANTQVGAGRSLYDQPLRAGCWTQEEMDYVNALMTDFRDGALLGVASGTTLRGYLAKNIHCGVKRVSKKLEGTSYNGRLTFKVKHHFSTAELRFRCGRLALLRAKFEQSVEDLKAKEAQNNEDGTGSGERREVEAHHLLPPSRASLSLQGHPLLGAAFGASTNDALLAEARGRFMGTSNSLLNDNRMAGLLTDTTMMPGLFNSGNQGLPGLTGGSFTLGAPLGESRVATFRQQQPQISMADHVLESIRVRRSAISENPFAENPFANAGANAPSSSPSLVSAALMRQNASAGLPPMSAFGRSLPDAELQAELLLRAQTGSISYAEAALEANRKRTALLMGRGPASVTTSTSETKLEDTEKPSKKRAKGM